MLISSRNENRFRTSNHNSSWKVLVILQPAPFSRHRWVFSWRYLERDETKDDGIYDVRGRTNKFRFNREQLCTLNAAIIRFQRHAEIQNRMTQCLCIYVCALKYRVF